jgi:hypothetical protein
VKRCKVCGQEYPLLDFRPTVVGLLWPDGRSNWCEACIALAEAFRDRGDWCSISELKSKVRRAMLGDRY